MSVLLSYELTSTLFMGKEEISRTERLEAYLVKLIQEPKADQGHTGAVRALLIFLKGISKIFHLIVQTRLQFYEWGILQQYPPGCQVISIGNITAGGTGKTPVTEIFARELQARGRRVAILSRGYRKKELPFWQRLFRDKIDPPRVVSDGKRILLDSEMGGDEPYMLANNLPGVVVLVDRNRVKCARFAVKRFKCDTLILDDGFQYQKLRHSHEIVLIDKTNPFGNGNLLPRGILREPLKNLKRADFIFITKSDGNSAELREQLQKYRPGAEIIECRHAPRYLRELYTDVQHDLEWLRGKRVAALSGIAVPRGFENFLRQLGATLVHCDRYADHHRYSSQEIIGAVNQAADLNADALITTEKDAVRFPRLSSTAVPVYYLRVDIEITKGADNFHDAVAYICFERKKSKAAK